MAKERSPKLAISFIAPLLILLIHPFGMNLNQSITVAALVLVVTWWSTGWVNKIIATCVLLLCFVLFSGASPKVVFTFLLSENFPMIALTYLFSQGITNSGLIEKVIQPFLGRHANSPHKILLSIIIVFVLTVYLVPQPLARLIIVASLFDKYMKNTDISSPARRVLMFGCFLFYALVNMLCISADLMLNTSSLAFAGLTMNDEQWMKNMAVPVVIYGALIFGLFSLVFRKELGEQKKVHLIMQPEKVRLKKHDKIALTIIIVTVLLWVTKGLHGINATVITLGATVAMFAVKLLSPKDLKSIDITTLVFLTGAFSIGSAMKASGSAEIIFSRMKDLFPSEYSIWYILLLAAIGKIMHLMLGSNTTTLSLIIPGLMIVSRDILSPEAIMYTAYVSVVVHSLLPFHSVAMMMGTARNYFTAKDVLRFGVPMLALMFVSIICVFLPWWQFVGII